MPKLPSTRVVDYDYEPEGSKKANPHSPWQLLVESTRIEKSINFRELADAIRKNTPTPISHSTIFIWINSRAPRPSLRKYTPQVNKAIADTLGIPSDTLATAYNASSESLPLNNPNPSPAPHDQILEALETMAETKPVTKRQITAAKQAAATLMQSTGTALPDKIIAVADALTQ